MDRDDNVTAWSSSAPPPTAHPRKSVWSSITVEPLLAFYIISMFLTILITQNLSLDKACRVNLGFDEAICDALIRQDGNNISS